MTFSWLQRFEQIQNSLLSTVEPAQPDDKAYVMRQHHPLLSPISWHVGHCVYIEALWIRGRLAGNCSLAKELEPTYRPEFVSKSDRQDIFKSPGKLFSWAQQLMLEHLGLLKSLSRSTEGMSPKYIAEFLINHHAQHRETIEMVKVARNQENGDEVPENFVSIRAKKGGLLLNTVPGGKYEVGSAGGFSFDNESPRHSVDLRPFKVAKMPVSNSQFLAFVEDGGYRNKMLWSAFGWHWKLKVSAEAPRSWRRGLEGGWSVQAPTGSQTSVDDIAVSGVTHYEASAFAQWAGLRLPHEYEWEVAATMNLISGRREVWEWCSNVFHPYHGFSPYTYPEYSIPWFDLRHYVLRGGSLYTEAEVQRISFRNYYIAETDYLSSGIRMAE